MQIGRIAVEPAQIALVDRLGVVVQRSVVVPRMPLAGQGRRQLQILGDLHRIQPVVGQAQVWSWMYL